MYEEKFMRAALELALEAAADGETPIGAVVVRKGEIVGKGRNRREKDRSALAHAELEAISEACKNLGGWRLWECDLYVTLEPCPMCTGAVIGARIVNVYFGAHDSKTGACGGVLDLTQAGFPHTVKVSGGHLEDECSSMIKTFFRQLRSGERQRASESKSNRWKSVN